MKKEIILTLVVSMFYCAGSLATASLNSCNDSSGECKALLKSVYVQDGIGYVELVGGLTPTSCTNATWGNNWRILLDNTGGSKEIYSVLLAAYMANQVVQIRSSDNFCTIRGAGVGM